MTEVHPPEPGLRHRWRLFLVLRIALVAALVAVAAGLLLVTVVVEERPDLVEPSWLVLVGVGLLAAVAEYIDSAVGMGFGTVVAPVLIVLGFDVVDVLAAVLLAEVVSGALAGVLHQRAANVDLGRGSSDRRVVETVVPFGMMGAAGAAVVASRLEQSWGEVIVGAVIVVTGLLVLAGRRITVETRRGRLVTLGVVAAVAKGLSSAGFGPVLTTGQLVLGRPERNTVGVTSAAEAPVSAVALIVLTAMEGWPGLALTLPLVVGGMLAVPAAVWTVRLLPGRTIRTAVALAAVFLGALAMVAV